MRPGTHHARRHGGRKIGEHPRHVLVEDVLVIIVFQLQLLSNGIRQLPGLDVAHGTHGFALESE